MSEVHQRTAPKRESYKPASIDVHVYEQLEKVTSSFEHSVELITFISNGSLGKLLSNWSALSLANNHSQFVDFSVKLARITFMINLLCGLDKYEAAVEQKGDEMTDHTIDPNVELSLLQLKSQILDFYKDLINNHTKVIYRCLSAYKPSMTNPVVKILVNAIKFDQSMATEIFNNFDLSLPILPQLLIPTKMDSSESSRRTRERERISLRANFLTFWIVWLSNLPSLVRKDIMLKNYKIMNNLWKFMSDVDSLELLSVIFTFLRNKVLLESNFKKLTKCFILSENFFIKTQPIFLRSLALTTHPFIEIFNNFTNTLLDAKNGLVYPMDKLWQKHDTALNEHVEFYHSIEINNQTFRINNKATYTLAIAMKPWESANQLEYVLKILAICPELIPIYSHWLVQNGGGYHDPALTAWWINHSLLYNNIVQLQLPAQILNLGNVATQSVKLDNKTIAETMCLAPVTRSSLNKSLETNKPLITQLSLQLILQICIKLKKFLDSNLIANKQELIELVFNRLPDIAGVVDVYNKNKLSQNSKLLNVTCLEVIKHYNEIYPKNSANSIALITKISSDGLTGLIETGLHDSTKYDLSLLNLFLSIQSNQNHDQLKWWNKSKDNNSFFTSLIKLGAASLTSTFDGSFIWRISSLLSALVDEKILFNRNLLVSPILAIIYSFDQFSINDLLPVWNLLDEVVSRCIRAPYKYLDLSHAKYSNTSVFVVALFEQFKFVLAKTKDISTVSKWILNLTRYLIVVGESKSALIQLKDDFLDNPEFTKLVESQNLLAIVDFKTSPVVHKESTTSFFSMIVNISNEDLISNISELESKPLLTKLDLSGLIFKLEFLLQDQKQYSDENYDKTLVALVSKLGIFVLSLADTDIYKYLLTAPFWTKFIISKENAVTSDIQKKKVLIGELLNEILHKLPISLVQGENDFNKYIFDIQSAPIDLQHQIFFSKFSWVLQKEQLAVLINNLVPSNSILSLTLLGLCVKAHVKVSASVLFDDILNSSIPSQYGKEKNLLISNAVELDLVSYSETLLEDISIDKILLDKEKHFLVKSLINSSNKSTIVKYLIAKTDEFADNQHLLCFIAYSISLNIEKMESYEGLNAFFEKATNIAAQSLSSKANIQWEHVLVILTNGMRIVEPQRKLELVREAFEYIQKTNAKNSMIPEFVQFINESINDSKDIDDKISSWIHRSMLYVTKKFAESSELSPRFDGFLAGLCKLIKKLSKLSISVWKLIPSSIINTQLEVVLQHSKWVLKAEYLEFVIAVVLASNKQGIAFEKQLQIFINNDFNILNNLPSPETSRARYTTALIIHSLYNINPSKNSSEPLMDRLVFFYLGSVRVEDLLIKTILIKIESQISKSWVCKVTNWEFSDELNNNEIELVGEERLIIETNTSLTVSVNKNFIKNTIQNYSGKLVEIPKVLESYFQEKKTLPIDKLMEAADAFYEHNIVYVDQSYIKSTYDVEFLMMVMINNEDLVRFAKPAQKKSDKTDTEPTKDIRAIKPIFDIQNLIETNLLQFLIMNFGHQSEYVRKISKVLVQGILNSIDDNDTFKDKNIFKVYLANVLNTFKGDELVPGVVWYIYSSFISVLCNPGYFLYEKCFRYVLGHPMIKNEIPMFTSIIFSMTDDSEAENDETYYRQISWMIDVLVEGTNTSEDLNLLRYRFVFEWILNLLNSPFITMRIKSQIFKFLSIVESLEQGSDTLITRYGFLTNMEQHLEKLNHSLNDEEDEQKSHLLDEQLKLNIKQIIVRLGITSASSKRIKDWTSDDLPKYVKRIHTE